MSIPAVVELDREDEWNIDYITERIGEFGLHQKRAYIICILTDVLVAMCILFFLFGDYQPGWHCEDKPAVVVTLQSVTASVPPVIAEAKERRKRESEKWKTTVAPPFMGGVSNTKRSGEPTPTPSAAPKLRTTISPPLMGKASEKPHSAPVRKEHGVCNATLCPVYTFDRFTSSFSTATEWGLVCDLEYVPILCIVLLFLGMFFGAFLTKLLADKIGRKKTLMLITFGAMLFQILTGVCRVWELYAFFRFVVGIFLGGMCRLSRVLPLEFTGVHWRSFVRFFSLFEVGYLMLLTLAFILQNWRHLAFVTGAMLSPLLILMFLFVPESGRWILHQERYLDLKDLVNMVAEENGRPLPAEEVKHFVKREKKTKAITESGYRYSMIDLFSTPKYGFRTGTVVFAWFTNSLIYYTTFVMIFLEPGDIFLNVLSAATTTFLALASTYPITGRFGRKMALGIFMLIPVSAIIVQIVFYGLGLRLRNVTIGVVMLSQGYFRAVDVIVGKYTNEIFPGELKNAAVGLGNMTARLAAIFAPLVAYSGYADNWISPFIIFLVFALLSGILLLASWPETGKKILTDQLPPPTDRCSRLRPGNSHEAGSLGKSSDDIKEMDVLPTVGNGTTVENSHCVEVDDSNDAYKKTKNA